MHDSDQRRRGRFSILYQRVGKGTQKMTEWKRGKKLDVIGPLGNGFRLPPPSPHPTLVLIGGGVGIVSLYPLAQKCKTLPILVFIGGKKADDLLCVREFKKFNSTLLIATEDGSVGFKGTVIDLFLSQDRKGWMGRSLHLYACGPIPMLQALARVLKPKGISCQASLEARMACGFGACWGCVVKTNDPKVPFQRVCKEGPIFHLEEILWEP
jgi:dihydroorotate dehydrogenase electron transfer subunit